MTIKFVFGPSFSFFPASSFLFVGAVLKQSEQVDWQIRPTKINNVIVHCYSLNVVWLKFSLDDIRIFKCKEYNLIIQNWISIILVINYLYYISADHSYNTMSSYVVVSGGVLWLFQPLHDNTINKFGNHSWAWPPTEVNFTASVQVKFSQNSGGTEFICSTLWAKPQLFKIQPQCTVGLWTLEHKHGIFL